MLDPDISTADAKRLLSLPGHLGDVAGPNGWTRRKFLQAVGGGVLGGAAISSFGDQLGLGRLGFDASQAFAKAAPVGAHEGIVVNIVLYGGNDGLNTVIPYSNGRYRDMRAPGGVAIPLGQELRLDDTFGLHPNLPYTKQLWDAGQLAIVHGVGYPNPDLSHFTSMAIWMNAKFGVGAAGTGWIGRWLDGQPAEDADLRAATIGSSVPLHLLGATRRAVAVPANGENMFGTGTNPADARMLNGLRSFSASSAGRGPWHDMYARVLKTQLQLAVDVKPVYSPPPTGGAFARRMTVAARLINADLGFRVLDIGLDGFDTHDNQPLSHADLLTQLDSGLSLFFATLNPSYYNRVTVMTMSEFGRTPYSNDSAGTDHGTANVQFVIGSNVKGGHYGQAPSFDTIDNQWERFGMTTDFRHVLGTVIDGWMGGGGSTVLNGAFENLGFFRTGPGDPPPGGGVPPIINPPSGPTEFVSMNPQRLFDTRDGTGGRLGPLGPTESWTVAVRGQMGVPAGAIAVAINLTAVDATSPTYVTAWPGGQAQPTTSNLNPVPGLAVPNLAIVRLGAAGDVNLYNNAGTVHLLGDVVGYFRDGTSVGMSPLAPARLLDTRDGTGGHLGALGGGQMLDLQVADRGGVSSHPEAVVLNVTVTGPTAGSYLTVWPSGEPQPYASSVNMAPGQTVPNMVMTRVGANGMVSIYNNAGSTDLIVDVLGCFDGDSSGRYVALTPQRVLDTRDGHRRHTCAGRTSADRGHPARQGRRAVRRRQWCDVERHRGRPDGQHIRHRVPRWHRVPNGVESQRVCRPGDPQHGVGQVGARRHGADVQQLRQHRSRCRRRGLLHRLVGVVAPAGWARNTSLTSVATMVDETRRGRLLAVKLATLIREHGAGSEVEPAPFALGAAATDGSVGWVLLDERQQRGLGPALAWAVRAGVAHLHVLAEEGTGTLARRAAAFRLPVEVWHIAERTLLPAIAEPLPAVLAVPEGHDQFRPLIIEGGAVPAVEHGVLVGEVRGLEVCRVVTDQQTGTARLEVGIGQHDREAFQMLHGDVPTVEALAKVVATVRPHREHGADPHPLNRIGAGACAAGQVDRGSWPDRRVTRRGIAIALAPRQPQGSSALRRTCGHRRVPEDRRGQ